jgi:hypothetical protein
MSLPTMDVVEEEEEEEEAVAVAAAAEEELEDESEAEDLSRAALRASMAAGIAPACSGTSCI